MALLLVALVAVSAEPKAELGHAGVHVNSVHGGHGVGHLGGGHGGGFAHGGLGHGGGYGNDHFVSFYNIDNNNYYYSWTLVTHRKGKT